MTDSFVTQCPHCRTSFRISRAQLGAAHGAVRCGACLHVFNAAQQLLVDQSRAVKPTAETAAAPAPTAPRPAAQPSVSPPSRPVAPTAPAPSAEKKPVDTLWIHDDLDLDSLDLDEELAKLEEQEMQLSQDFLAIDRAPKPSERLFTPAEPERDRHDESWAESLLIDEKPARKIEPEFKAEPRIDVPPAPAPRPIPASFPPPLDDLPPAARREPSFAHAQHVLPDEEPALRDEPPLSALAEP
ncbi:MAG: MJ0042-type zinc finger domain-containing protein, partial [Pseudomonas sp.]